MEAMHLTRDPSDEEILHLVDAWIDDLAHGDYEGAFLRTEHDPYYQWTPKLMRSVVQGYVGCARFLDHKIRK